MKERITDARAWHGNEGVSKHLIAEQEVNFANSEFPIRIQLFKKGCLTEVDGCLSENSAVTHSTTECEETETTKKIIYFRKRGILVFLNRLDNAE